MTDRPKEPHSLDANDDEQPLDPWMMTLARDIADDVVVPRELMWKRIQHRRAAHTMPKWWRNIAAIAAVLVGGIAIGRHGVPRTTIPSPTLMTELAAARSTAPARVAMEEHLVRTVALLTTVRDRDPELGPGPDVSSWARELLGTTRLLLDEPSLRDDRTKRLWQDLELVLMQILQSRGTAAPEAQRAPTETMRETNLLPRVRAVMTASARRDELTVHGDDE